MHSMHCSLMRLICTRNELVHNVFGYLDEILAQASEIALCSPCL